MAYARSALFFLVAKRIRFLEALRGEEMNYLCREFYEMALSGFHPSDPYGHCAVSGWLWSNCGIENGMSLSTRTFVHQYAVTK